MTNEQGNLAINSENIFPIIKKWLYSDHDIFIREVVSNACDAITKLKKLDLMSETSLPDDYKAKIEVEVNPEDKTITFTDNGLGMTADEVKEYINQIAFSGAADFLEKYKDKANEEQIIGHFGLGFYSVFMVADSAEIHTLSYKEGSEAVHWESDGGLTFEMGPSDKDTVGTRIILHLNEDSYEFANEYRVREVLDKYCSFMPVEIFLTKANAEPEYETIPSEEVTEEDTVIEEIVEEPKEDDKKEGEEAKEPVKKTKILKRPVSISDTHPLWAKHPNECTEEEYKTFYRKVFNDYREPLFWIHLNMDYPFNLKGILYFPKVNLEYENVEGMIKLYNNQVFIADNIKEVIPEFLMLLKGVIDCPDLPLNVSRSALQNDGFVKKISDYITKKVADKLSGMCKTDRENYEKYWDDISPFIKFGCLKDEKFKEKIKDYVLFKDLDDKYSTLKEYLETIPEPEVEAEVVEEGKEDEKSSEETEAPKKIVYYVTDLQQQSQYVKMFREQDMNAVVLLHNIDQPFVSALEAGDDDVKFQRIDADLTDAFKEEGDEEKLKEDTETLKELFRKATGKDQLEVKVEKLKNDKVSSMITLSEEARRMQDMMKMYSANGMGGMELPDVGQTLVLNANNDLVQYLLANKDGEHSDMFCKQLYDLAMISHQPLQADKMTEFINRSNEIMMLLTK
ncbi:molecular chaperone HtpG [Clostridium sp. AF36-4]|uniref:molecular chaperone HtpG n=1 Tax=Clostridium sp. AF36-4 TaxID=2293015 RepID=UPI000E3F3852|nr:molecular chaperone HtpG [Clostridium sp. AF36-4]RGF57684.1 molecular chaperone HtpG [Clostridium sp. AF36-4]